MTRLRDYHTIQGWHSEEEMWDELQRNHAEAEYFAQIGPVTHDYPPTATSTILIGNEPISWEQPF